MSSNVRRSIVAEGPFSGSFFLDVAQSQNSSSSASLKLVCHRSRIRIAFFLRPLSICLPRCRLFIFPFFLPSIIKMLQACLDKHICKESSSAGVELTCRDLLKLSIPFGWTIAACCLYAYYTIEPVARGT